MVISLISNDYVPVLVARSLFFFGLTGYRIYKCLEWYLSCGTVLLLFLNFFVLEFNKILLISLPLLIVSPPTTSIVNAFWDLFMSKVFFFFFHFHFVVFTLLWGYSNFSIHLLDKSHIPFIRFTIIHAVPSMRTWLKSQNVLLTTRYAFNVTKILISEITLYI